MNKETIRKIFEQYTKHNLIKNVPIENGWVDYEILSDNKKIAIEVKGARAGENSTIGKLLSIKRTYSHIYLLAPINFLKKIEKIIQNTNTLTDVGVMFVDSEGVRIIKEPSPEKYYYNTPLKQPKKLQKHMIVNEPDVLIESYFKNQTFTISEASRVLGIPMKKTYHRIARLKAVGMIEEIPHGGNPKSFRFIKTRKVNEKIDV